MKFWGSLVLLAGIGCSTASRPGAPQPDRTFEAPEEGTFGAREMVNRLRVETSWQPPSTGGQCVSCFYELPYGSYVAQGWWYYRAPCCWEPVFRWSRYCWPISAYPQW